MWIGPQTKFLCDVALLYEPGVRAARDAEELTENQGLEKASSR